MQISKRPARSTEATEGNQDPSSLPSHEGKLDEVFGPSLRFFPPNSPLEFLHALCASRIPASFGRAPCSSVLFTASVLEIRQAGFLRCLVLRNRSGGESALCVAFAMFRQQGPFVRRPASHPRALQRLAMVLLPDRRV